MSSSRDLFRAQLSLTSGPMPDNLGEIYAPGVVLEFPFASPEQFTRFEGAEAIAEYMFNTRYSETLTLSEPAIYENASGFVAEYWAEVDLFEVGVVYTQDFVAVVDVQDGRIARWREYRDPAREARAVSELNINALD